MNNIYLSVPPRSIYKIHKGVHQFLVICCVELSLHRAAIGLHYVKCHSYVTTKRSKIYAHRLLHDTTLSSLAEELLTQLRFNCVILTLLFIQAQTNNKIPVLHLYLLIYLANDIERNPGPSNDILTIFQLNMRSLRNKISYLSDIAFRL